MRIRSIEVRHFCWEWEVRFLLWTVLSTGVLSVGGGGVFVVGIDGN